MLPHEIDSVVKHKTELQLSLNSPESVMNTRTQLITHFIFFIYLLPKKRKCSITSHTEMYCLRKKIYS